MKCIIFDPYSGASGDMIIGALVDLGANKNKITTAINSIPSVSISINKINKKGINATKITIKPSENSGEKTKNLSEILSILESTNTSRNVKNHSKQIFQLIANAESKVHGEPIDKIHFHEIGSSDAMADVVGTCVALEDLDLLNTPIYCTQISVGSGTVETSHGKLPVPAPATTEILTKSKLLFCGGPVKKELLTPTGAAILTHFSTPVEFFPPMQAKSSGFGAGTMELEFPNVLRAVIGELNGELLPDNIELLETHVDNVSSEVLGNLIDTLMTSGALDVAIVPATMKKNRPGHIIKVVSKPQDSQKLSQKIVQETGSLGVRATSCNHRFIANRKIETLQLKIKNKTFETRIKKAFDSQGILLNISCEFEDAKKIAKQTNIPVKEIIKYTEVKARNLNIK